MKQKTIALVLVLEQSRNKVGKSLCRSLPGLLLAQDGVCLKAMKLYRTELEGRG